MTITEAMRQFREALERWIPYMRRATHFTDISVQSKDRDVVVVFRSNNFEHEHRFTAMQVYGYTGTRSIQPHRKVCRFADIAILSVLQECRDRKKEN